MAMKIISCYTINPRSSVRKPCAVRVLPNWPLGYHPDPQRAGKLTPRVLSLVVEWAGLYQSQLQTNWELAKQQRPLEKIHPLE